MLNKKAWFTALTMTLSLGLLAGCGGSTNNAGNNAAQNSTGGQAASQGYVPQQLSVQFVPSQSAETLEAKAKPLEKLLSDKLGIPVKVSVSTNYNTIIEAMASKKVDVGFLPPSAYVMAKDKGAADVILQTQRYAVNPDGSPDKTKLVDNYRSEVIVKAGSPIKAWTDLKGKKFGWQDVTSTAGYVLPAVEMKKAGMNPDTDVQGMTFKGHDKAVLAVLNGDVDAAAVFEDARQTVKKDVPDINDKVKAVLFTQPTPNDTVSVRTDMDPAWKTKIQQALIDIAKTDQGKQICESVYSIEGFSPSQDKNFDVVREYNKYIGTNK